MKSLRQYHAKAFEFAQRALADGQARHGALERCLRVAPGSLVEQWQTSPSEKFELRLDPLTHSHVESSATGNPSVKDPRWIARRDQLSRKTAWNDKPCLLKINCRASTTRKESSYRSMLRKGVGIWASFP